MKIPGHSLVYGSSDGITIFARQVHERVRRAARDGTSGVDAFAPSPQSASSCGLTAHGRSLPRNANAQPGGRTRTGRPNGARRRRRICDHTEERDLRRRLQAGNDQCRTGAPKWGFPASFPTPARRGGRCDCAVCADDRRALAKRDAARPIGHGGGGVAVRARAERISSGTRSRRRPGNAGNRRQPASSGGESRGASSRIGV
jgi:hypothetical protein